MSGQYPNTYYRVATKALIKNEKGEVLLVQENSDKWDLPGGGLDHEEAPEDGLRRELQEEIGFSDIQIGRIVAMKPFWIEDKQAWLMWVVYDVILPADAQLLPGNGVTGIEYINADTLRSSPDERESYIPTLLNL